MIVDYVERQQSRLIGLTRELIRIPSENTAPAGAERACQEHIAHVLQRSGWDAVLYELSEVKGLHEHPLFWPGRDYTNRPNLGARRKGSGGRSLVLSGHVDTVPRGTQPWTRDAFGGDVDGNRVYGRGANDMKAGIAMNLFIAEAIANLQIRLRGDLVFESVIDEEFGGVNGTLAGRLHGYNGDAAVISEPSFLRICPAQRGGRVAHITFRATGGVLTEGKFPAGVNEQLTYFLKNVPEFAAQRRRNTRVHELYAHHADPVPVSITKVFTSPWGTSEPITIPEVCKVEFYWQLMPGETQNQVEREFFSWLDGVVRSRPDIFPTPPEVEFPIRWMPGSAIATSEPLVRELATCAEAVLGTRPKIEGIEGPCDMFVFHQGFSIPAVLWGPRGGNTHAADEYVEIDSLVDAATTLLLFVCHWCGVA
ncbi:MAG TPA: M20/M25/M40 family metallo-hydrolase [Bryobacteraceae bacterium]|nr:M20/M25/M40 family metallo-hydrolase [Bryobacteraceae bacterium]